MTPLGEDPEFLAIFRDEAVGRLDAMVGILLAAESGAAAPDAVAELFRHAHSLKGAAGMVGLAEMAATAHALEDVLDDARRAGALPPGLPASLLQAIDVLRAQLDGGETAAAAAIAALAAAPVAATVTAAPALAAPEDVHEDAPPAPPGRAPDAAPPADARAIRVPAAKLDRLLDLVGETVLHRARLEHATAGAGAVAVAEELDAGGRLLAELTDVALDMRTLPLASIAGPFPRAVRDLATAEGKEVELVLTGAATELDRVILEGLSDPLTHLLRNAVGHGIEPPGERAAAGKPRRARLELRAEQRGAQVAITVGDDGRGVAPEVLRRADGAGGLADVLAAPGYSTAREVTSLSGRGVGLDAVRAHVESFGGTLEVASAPGRGTEVTLLLPLTLALLDVLLVRRGAHTLGIPLTAVGEVLTVGTVLTLTGRDHVELRGEAVPVADLADLLGAEAPEAPPRPPALVVAAAGRRIAVVCDHLLGEEQVVVKPLGPLLARAPGYLGAAILGDGRVALLLDPVALVTGAPRARPRAAAAAPEAPAPATLLVVEDSFTVRELQRSIFEAAGYRVRTARDGREALSLLEAGPVDMVVTDLEMPELDGLGLTRAIRADERFASLPVAIVTSLDSDAARARGAEAGADAFMAKGGYDQRTLLEVVERLVGR